MDPWTAPPVEARALFHDERSDLLALLDELPLKRWAAASAAEGWMVKDIALHLLDGDLGRLSRDRDSDLTGVLHVEDSDSLADALAVSNDRWIQATRRLSPRVILDLLVHSTSQIDEWTAQADIFEPARVSWASDEPVPTWLDQAREFTETWVHHQQIREATGLCSSTARLPDVLGIFVWAYPHQYRVPAPAGVCVGIDLDTGGRWHLVSKGRSRWDLELGPAVEPTASLKFSADAAWRSLTGAAVPDEGVTSAGPERLTQPLLSVRGIIA